MNFDFSATYAALWCLVVFQSLVMLALLRQISELRRLADRGLFPSGDQLPMGTRAPDFVGFEQYAAHLPEYGVLESHGGIILFVSPNCSACSGLVDSLGKQDRNDLPTVIMFCQGSEQECGAIERRLGEAIPVFSRGAAETAARYRISGFPTAVLVDEDRRIRAYGHPKDVGDLRHLVSNAFTQSFETHAPNQSPGFEMNSVTNR